MSEVRYTIRDSRLGRTLVAWSERGLRAVLLGDDDDELIGDLARRSPRSTLTRDDDSALAAEVVACIDAPARPLKAELDLEGTEFQRAVWRALREIPPGRTTSYAEVARRVGRPGSVRAVGQAIAANPLAVIVPCHRVIRSDGALSGYRWGVERKRRLLESEAAV